jgi:hypothetical protein
MLTGFDFVLVGLAALAAGAVNVLDEFKELGKGNTLLLPCG